MSQRWGFYATMDGAKLEQCDDGELVKYDDHEAALAEKESALAAERAKVRELVEALKFYQAASYPVATRLNSYGLGWRESHLSDAHKEAETLIEKYKGGTEQ